MRFRPLAATLLASLALAACQDAPAEAPNAAASDEAASGDVFDAYLPWPSGGEGVTRTASGLEYVIISEGAEGGASPTARDSVTVMYEGRLARTGEVFDSSYATGETVTFPLGAVIPGWTEGLQHLSVGDEALFYIPAELGYGDTPPPNSTIRPGDDLVFRVELRDVAEAPPPRPTDEEAWQNYTPWDSTREAVRSTGSGLEYVVLEGAEEGTSPEPQDRVVVYYEGRLDATGEVFDSAFQRGEPAIFPAGRLIPGWVEALSLMKPGERWLIHVPSELGYGEQGTPGGPIPPGADLNFEIELVDVLEVR